MDDIVLLTEWCWKWRLVVKQDKAQILDKNHWIEVQLFLILFQQRCHILISINNPGLMLDEHMIFKDDVFF